MTMTTGVGTPFYMAPELLQGQTHYTKAVDVYSYGVMSSQVYTGSLKYDGVSFDNIYCLFPFFSHFTHFLLLLFSFVFMMMNHWTAFVTQVCEGLRPSLTDCPQPLCSLIESCWDGTPSNRPCLSLSFFRSSILSFFTHHQTLLMEQRFLTL